LNWLSMKDCCLQVIKGRRRADRCRGRALRRAAQTVAQAELLQRIKRLRDGDSRTFGSCIYRWDQWRPQPTGSRTTTVTGCGTASVAVACTALKLITLPVAEPQVWSPWRLPEPGPEERMVVSLCANALPLPAPAPATAAPKPEKQQKAAKP